LKICDFLIFIESDATENTFSHDELMSRLNQLEQEEQEAEQQQHDKIMASIENGTFGNADNENEKIYRKLSGGEDEMSVRRRQVKFRNLADSLSGDESDNMIHFEHTRTLVVSFP